VAPIRGCPHYRQAGERTVTALWDRIGIRGVGVHPLRVPRRPEPSGLCFNRIGNWSSLAAERDGGAVINWNTFDLNLLVVFDAVMREKNLTRTGQRLGLTQSAVSHALARLRHMLNDELFIRSPEGMLPTPRAERMAGPVRQALEEMRVVLEADEFDPSRASRTFRIAANNHAARAVIPAFVRRVARLAPSVVIEVRPVGALRALDQLDGGAVELALAALTEGGERFKCVSLLEDEYVAILSSDHPMTGGPTLSIADLGAMPHITITSSGEDTRFVDDALAEHGLTRHVWAALPLHSLTQVLAGSEAVAIVPRRVAADFMAVRPLVIRPLPFPSPHVSLAMLWHRRLDLDPAHRWLRATLRASVKES
jgi:DNA-binding transcriptional LysR family regulator